MTHSEEIVLLRAQIDNDQNELTRLDLLIDEQEEEIVNVKSINTDLQRECTKRAMRIADLERLIARAANALDCHNLDHLQDDLITDLRKAAQ